MHRCPHVLCHPISIYWLSINYEVIVKAMNCRSYKNIKHEKSTLLKNTCGYCSDNKLTVTYDSDVIVYVSLFVYVQVSLSVCCFFVDLVDCLFRVF